MRRTLILDVDRSDAVEIAMDRANAAIARQPVGGSGTVPGAVNEHESAVCQGLSDCACTAQGRDFIGAEPELGKHLSVSAPSRGGAKR